MKVRNWIAGVGSLVLVGAAVVGAADDAKPADNTPKAEKPDHHGRTRLPKAYAQLSDLSDDQKQKLADIHEKTVQEMHALEAKERDDMRSVLTDAQRTELDDWTAKNKEETRAKRSELRLEDRVKTDEEKLKEAREKAAGEPTTKPDSTK